MQPDTAGIYDQTPIIESHRALQMRVSAENQCRVSIASAAFDLIDCRHSATVFRYGLEEVAQVASRRAVHKQNVFVKPQGYWLITAGGKEFTAFIRHDNSWWIAESVSTNDARPITRVKAYRTDDNPQAALIAWVFSQGQPVIIKQR